MEAMRLGMSSCGFQELSEENFKALQEAGVKELEVSLSEEKYDTLDYQAVKEKADRYGIHLWSFHLPYAPFSTVNPASTNEEKRVATLEYFKSLIKKAVAIGIKVFVVHPSREPYEDSEREAALEMAKKSMSELADFADGLGAVIAVEDLPRTCIGRNSSEIKEILSGNEKLRVVFDTNHLLGEPIKDFIRAVGDRIVTTHISDYDFKNERHWLPGEGDIDWKELISELENVNYQGPLLYELGLTPPVTGSINRRDMTFLDIKENHEALKNKKDLKPIGTRVPENCPHWTELLKK